VEVVGEDNEITNAADIDEFRDRYQYASAYFLETINPRWLILLATPKTPPAIWTAFQDKLDRQNTSSFFDQLNAVLDSQYNTFEPIADHINKYDTLWNRMQYCCTSALATD